ncbi:hypothetical protein [Cellulomonas persica]|uniref:Uncharacterized protein n=1 Tax=Cellulomonas persica TaxID=76861 RepID=A0A510UPJ1_9CELL|nr:hypothetical protein [Cellulomonas persica]GEK16386.1 hypothetical protein CPE01_01190 [Cellulomonas persica]
MSDEVPVTGQVLVREGVFRLRVPQDWTATGLEGHRYRLRSAGLDASVDVSVHHGEAAAPDARETVRAYARSCGAPDDVPLLPLHGDERPTALRAGARWADGASWRVAAALSSGHDVVLAAAAAGDDEGRAAVERIVTTLEPHQRDRRWWRRRR